MKKKPLYIVSSITIVLAIIIISIVSTSVFFNKRDNKGELVDDSSLSENILESDKSVSKIVLQSEDTVSENVNKQKELDNSKENITKEKIVKHIVAIDAGHQLHGNYEQEPIGQGSGETKAKVSSGTEGSFTKVPEYKINLEVALKLQSELENKGYEVVMIRSINDVNISNIERANIANESNAQILVRIHCNGSDDSSQKGALTMCPTSNNPYVSNLYIKSRELSEAILSSLCMETGAKRYNIIETDTMSGINWSKIPVTIIEMGFMTNKEEDYLLNSSDYQKKLVAGIANGIDSYFN